MGNDKVIICKHCGNEFIFTEGEQDFYKKNELDEPKRCKQCREEKKKIFYAIDKGIKE
jgi:NAD-dependent SIR2 family protein deacetylase